MTPQTNKSGSSDPLSYTCTCPASSSPSGGLILLFYRYFSQPPTLPECHHGNLAAGAAKELAAYHTTLTGRYNLGGKIRVATEGFNVTVGGTTAEIEAYVADLLPHWSFDGLDLGSEEARRSFFKPSPGCGCAFGGEAKVGVKEEITPLGVSGFAPRDWGVVRSLEPWEWHEVFLRESEVVDVGGDDDEEKRERVLIDVRNHYGEMSPESRIGYFIDPQTNTPAIRPGIRRFSQWPAFASRYFSVPSTTPKVPATHFSPPQPSGDPQAQVETQTPRRREIFTYCTGGIRCEKGVRWLASHLNDGPSTSTTSSPASSGPAPSDGATTMSTTTANDTIYTLKGGISAYLMWMDDEITAGRKTPRDSLFKGRNYVFDGRASVGLNVVARSRHGEDVGEKEGNDEEEEGEGEEEKVSACHGCGRPEDRVVKCSVEGCHLVLVACEGCEKGEGGVRCCEGCEDLEGRGGRRGEMCACEKARERELWGEEGQVKIGKGKKQRRGMVFRGGGGGGSGAGRVMNVNGKRKQRGFEVGESRIQVEVETIG